MANVIGQGISPMLGVHDAEAAIQFYGDAFGAIEVGERHAWEVKIGHAELQIGTAKIMLADEIPAYNKSPRTLGGTPVILHLEVDDVDALTVRAVEAGAELLKAPTSESYGRTSKLCDPFGHVWMLWAQI